SSLIGSSEENLRRAIRVAESVSPTVLWIDEIEKGLAGNAGAAVTDSGVSARVFGSLLTWLQEKTAPVFVVATGNRIDALPPELRHAHVLKAVEEAFPLSATMGEEISRLREWAKNRTRPASTAQRLAVAGLWPAG